MNIKYYSFGNPLKVKFREHYCYKCGAKLSIVQHRKVVDQKSDEAKYYDFSVGSFGGVMGGPCEFVHNVFYCSKCAKSIEFVTQINQEDIDILLKKIQKIFSKKGRKINIKKNFENTKNGVVENCDIESAKNLNILIEENGEHSVIFRSPKTRKKHWERPYYFNINKRDLINSIK